MFAYAQAVIYFILLAAVFLLAGYALIDAARRPARAFTSAGKRTKGFWVGVLALATAVAFVALPWPLGFGRLEFLALISAIAAGVYLADVRPAVGPYSGRGGRGGSSGW